MRFMRARATVMLAPRVCGPVLRRFAGNDPEQHRVGAAGIQGGLVTVGVSLANRP